MYYSERNIESFTATEEEFQVKIDKFKPKYLVLTAWEPSPEWTYGYPIENQDRIKPTMAYFFDPEQKKPAVVIYEFAYDTNGNTN